MAKPFKILLWIVGGFIGLLVVAAIALPLVVDPNAHKGQITGAVHDATGRELKINGDIKIKVFPWLGANVSNVELENAKGFGPEPFAKIGDMTVGIRVMPLLFQRRVEVATIHIDGLALNLAKDKDGKTNWADLSGNEKEKPAQQPAAPVHTGGPMPAISVGGLDIKNVTLSYADQQAGSAYKVADLSVKTGAIELGKPIDVVIGFIVSSTKPQLESDVKIAFTANANLDAKIYEIKDLKFDSTTKGPTVPGGSQKASMKAGATYDQGKGTFALTDGVLEAAGLKINAAFAGEGLSTETPKISGKLSSNTFNPKELAKSFGVAPPPTSDASALTQASFGTELAGSTKSARLENLTLRLDKTTATGRVDIADLAKQTIDFVLKADTFDADGYMAPAAAGDKDKKETADKGKSGDFKSTEIPIEALDAVNAHGVIELGSLTVKGMKMSAIKIVLNALKGQPKTEDLSGSLYGGKISQSAVFTHHSPAHYDMKVALDAINSAPLLKDLIGKSYLSGLGNFALNVSSGGTTVGDVLKGLSGTVGTNFKDGALEGFNLEQTIAGAKAALSGQAAPATTEPKRTEFKDLKAAGKIVNGVLNTDSLDVKGSWFQLGGNGSVNLVDQTLNYTLLPTVSGDKYKELAGQKIPVQVTGSWTDPKVKVDLAGIARGKVQEKVEQQKEKAKERFGDFLRKQLAPPPQQQPSQPQQPPGSSGQQPAPTPPPKQ